MCVCVCVCVHARALPGGGGGGGGSILVSTCSDFTAPNPPPELLLYSTHERLASQNIGEYAQSAYIGVVAISGSSEPNKHKI